MAISRRTTSRRLPRRRKFYLIGKFLQAARKDVTGAVRKRRDWKAARGTNTLCIRPCEKFSRGEIAVEIAIRKLFHRIPLE